MKEVTKDYLNEKTFHFPDLTPPHAAAPCS